VVPGGGAVSYERGTPVIKVSPKEFYAYVYYRSIITWPPCTPLREGSARPLPERSLGRAQKELSFALGEVRALTDVPRS